MRVMKDKKEINLTVEERYWISNIRKIIEEIHSELGDIEDIRDLCEYGDNGFQTFLLLDTVQELF